MVNYLWKLKLVVTSTKIEITKISKNKIQVIFIIPLCQTNDPLPTVVGSTDPGSSELHKDSVRSRATSHSDALQAEIHVTKTENHVTLNNQVTSPDKQAAQSEQHDTKFDELLRKSEKHNENVDQLLEKSDTKSDNQPESAKSDKVKSQKSDKSENLDAKSNKTDKSDTESIKSDKSENQAEKSSKSGKLDVKSDKSDTESIKSNKSSKSSRSEKLDRHVTKLGNPNKNDADLEKLDNQSIKSEKFDKNDAKSDDHSAKSQDLSTPAITENVKSDDLEGPKTKDEGEMAKAFETVDGLIYTALVAQEHSQSNSPQLLIMRTPQSEVLVASSKSNLEENNETDIEKPTEKQEKISAPVVNDKSSKQHDVADIVTDVIQDSIILAAKSDAEKEDTVDITEENKLAQSSGENELSEAINNVDDHLIEAALLEKNRNIDKASPLLEHEHLVTDSSKNNNVNTEVTSRTSSNTSLHHHASEQTGFGEF
jgi:hypothetical protein